MNRRRLLRSIALILMTGPACLIDAIAVAAGRKPDKEMHMHCAKVCEDCAAVCRACAKHCASMVAAGQKEHEKTRKLSEDNAEICAVAAKICRRGGPATEAICRACAEICDKCGPECGKYPSMKQMKDCAQSCAGCSKVCKDMVKSYKA